MKKPNNIPQSMQEWVNEIINAYTDAAETIPFGPVAGVEITDRELFHLAPIVCIKFRGIERTTKNLKIVTEAALSSYVANDHVHGDTPEHSIMSFALCYVVSHYALELIEEKKSEDILNFMGQHLNEIKKSIES
ncbi:MAG: hypothetical protein HZB37_09300 [Planctomycetes bacterium]|nr:hypothetical protein [Planctomycetota bacterium]